MSSSSRRPTRVCWVGPANGAPRLETLVESESWDCVRSESTSGMLRRLRSDGTIDLVILTPGEIVDPFVELCRDVKFDSRTAHLAVVFLLATDSADHRLEAYEAGADDCMPAAAATRELLLRLSNVLRVKRASDTLEDSTSVVTSLASAIEGRDAYTHGHVERVSAYSVEIGRRLGVDDDDLHALKVGGIVHDIGKVLVPDSILNKPGKLDDVEMQLVQRHSIIGYNILKPLRMFRNVLPIVRGHHERPNGKGYPDGLEGDRFPLPPRIVAVADVFDALSTSRPYRQALPLPKCMEILNMAAEEEDLDPSVVAILVGILNEDMPIPSLAAAPA